ncbi:MULTISPECIES: hypothetical protein [Rhodopseudomonas]|nr:MULTISPECIES: hypothetical protein [Rhodopseudomonas]WOK16106.1 hypothetical protein RBJ75_18280 [Rhodopseudomonas sp. BAL398]
MALYLGSAGCDENPGSNENDIAERAVDAGARHRSRRCGMDNADAGCNPPRGRKSVL